MHHRIATACVLAIMLFTLTGCYRHDKLGDTPVRTNRLTGKTERLTANGWQEMKSPAARGSRELSEEELARLTGRAGLDRSGTFTATVYNGNDFPVTKIVFWVELTDKDGKTVEEGKRYRSPDFYSIPALGTKEIIIREMDIRTSDSVKHAWNIVAAEATD